MWAHSHHFTSMHMPYSMWVRPPQTTWLLSPPHVGAFPILHVGTVQTHNLGGPHNLRAQNSNYTWMKSPKSIWVQLSHTRVQSPHQTCGYRPHTPDGFRTHSPVGSVPNPGESRPHPPVGTDTSTLVGTDPKYRWVQKPTPA